MNLRPKTLALIITTFVASAAALMYLANSITRTSYETIEVQSANRDLQRLEKVFLADLKRLFSVLEDFASWDDTYDFVGSRDESYIASNFAADTFSVPGIEFVLITDGNGDAIYASSYNVPDELGEPTIDYLKQLLSLDGELYEYHPEEFGLITIGTGTMAIAMAPILQSNDTGPSRGNMLVGRFLDSGALDELRLKTQLDLTFENLSMVSPSVGNISDIDEMLERTLTEPISLTYPLHEIVPVDDLNLVGYILMLDILGEPNLLWSVRIKRDIFQQGIKSLHFLLAAMAIIGVILIVSVILLLDRLVLRRVALLGNEVSEIGRKDDLSVRVVVDGPDELGRLGQTVNWMLEQLQVSRKKADDEHERAENLLLNILPASIAEQLKSTEEPIANSHKDVSVLFADLAGFTPLSAKMAPVDLVTMLNGIFSRFDDLTHSRGLEKIKTIGDAYMVAAGIPEFRDDHAEAIADMALDMINVTEDFATKTEVPLQIRIGINSGAVVAGVIGKKKFIYDLWGDTVNIASRMESSGETGMVQVTKATYEKLKDDFVLSKRGTVDVKGRGKMTTYVLLRRNSEE
ncbi:MAG: adenylate/guanylate cyclase domain-containing protein [Roseibium sp.]